MRALLLLLILANAAFFVWSAGYFGGTMDGREPERLSAQLRPEAIRLLPPQAAVSRVCRMASGLGTPDSDRVAALRSLVGQHAALALDVRTQPAPAEFWLLVPAMPSLAAAQKRLGELRAAFAEAQAIADAANGPFIVKLGVFAGRAAADERLAAVDGRGGKAPAIVVERPGSGDVALARIEAPADAKAAWDALQGWAATQSGITLGDCPAP